MRKILKLAIFTKEELWEAKGDRTTIWNLFEKKIITPMKIIFVADIYEKYLRYMLNKFKANGYQRL